MNDTAKKATTGTTQPSVLDKTPDKALPTKESEPQQNIDQGEIVAEIRSQSEAIDNEAIARLQESFPDIEHARPKIQLSPDVEDSGVFDIDEEADRVVAKGSTLELPISEEEYKKATKSQPGGHSVKGAVVGASSLFALGLWIKRIVKLAHTHAKKVVFRKTSPAEPGSALPERKVEDAN